MLGLVEITPWHWAGFVLCVLFFLALDLGLFHRRARTVKFREAAAWSALWFALAMAFAGALVHWRGREEAIQFTTGYLIELSLSHGQRLRHRAHLCFFPGAVRNTSIACCSGASWARC